MDSSLGGSSSGDGGSSAERPFRRAAAPTHHQQLSKPRLAGLTPPRAGPAAPVHCTHPALPPPPHPALCHLLLLSPREDTKDSKDASGLLRHRVFHSVNCASPSQNSKDCSGCEISLAVPTSQIAESGRRIAFSDSCISPCCT